MFCRAHIFNKVLTYIFALSKERTDFLTNISHRTVLPSNRLTIAYSTDILKGQILNMKLNDVIKTLNNFAPLNLAASWDNVGLLVEPNKPRQVSTLLLTNDLTEQVLDEAICKNADLIYSYHPPIFTPLKSLTAKKWKDRIILRCIENHIAVYSPHTALDAIKGGVNDWLLGCFDISSSEPLQTSCISSPFSYCVYASVPVEWNLGPLEALLDTSLSVICTDSTIKNVTVSVTKASLAHVMEFLSRDSAVLASTKVMKLEAPPLPGTGMGRYGQLQKPVTIRQAVEAVKKHLGLDYVRLALPSKSTIDSLISTVAMCAGSGTSVLKGISANLYVTGEMSHHDLLDAVHQNTAVILCEHSNTERGYLRHLASIFQEKMKEVQIIVSEADRDPLTTV